MYLCWSVLPPSSRQEHRAPGWRHTTWVTSSWQILPKRTVHKQTLPSLVLPRSDALHCILLLLLALRPHLVAARCSCRNQLAAEPVQACHPV